MNSCWLIHLNPTSAVCPLLSLNSFLIIFMAQGLCIWGVVCMAVWVPETGVMPQSIHMSESLVQQLECLEQVDFSATNWSSTSATEAPVSVWAAAGTGKTLSSRLVGAQNWTQNSRSGLNSAEERARITTINLLAALLLMQARI